MELDISENTLRRSLDDVELYSYRAARNSFISVKNRKARLEFAKVYRSWIVEQLRQTLWSEESKFNLKGPYGKRNVRRPFGKRLKQVYTIGIVKHRGDKGFMVWGCFSGFSRLGPLYRIEGIMDKYIYNSILENQMLPFVNENMPLRWTFQQDNYHKHTSKLIKSWYDTYKITLMQWPAQYPELNPIENLWKQLDGKVCFHGSEMLKNCIRNFKLPVHK